MRHHQQPLCLDISSAAFLSDPYAAYGVWREAGPIHWSSAFYGGAWVITRHADVDRVLRDDGGFSARRTGAWVSGVEQERGELRSFHSLLARAMLFVDAPDHTRLRRVLNVGFRPARLEALRPVIEASVQARLDTVDAQTGFDFISEVAAPVPAQVIGEMMGLPSGRQSDFQTWSQDLAGFIGALGPNTELARRAQRSLLEMTGFFMDHLRDRGDEPRDDLVGLLLEAEQVGQVKEGAELLAQCAMLLFAGYETTRNLLGNGLLALLRHRSEWRLLQEDPSRASDAVRELLRFDSPVQYTARRVVRDQVLHDVPLRRGDCVIALIGSANRDPRCYSNPDELNIARRPPGLLSFGRGAHACLGAALTQMEAEVVFREVAKRWPTLRLMDDHPQWNGNTAYRGLHQLRVQQAQVRSRTGSVGDSTPGQRALRTDKVLAS